MAETLSARALCTLADVRTYIETDPLDIDENDVLVRLINSASQIIHSVSGREFKAYSTVPTPPQTRLFDLTWRHETNRVLSVGDLATLTSISAADENGTALGTIATGNVVSLPRTREAWEPIRRLRFLSAANYIVASNVLSISGTWGFVSVPDDVRQACIETVAVWHGRDIEHISDTYAQAGGSAIVGAVGGRELTRSLPRRAWDIANSYRMMAVV